MNSIFTRALVGFIILTIGLFCMVYMALWSLDKYANGIWWGGLLITAFGLASQLSIFLSTLWDPIRDWINEPKKQAEARAERDREAQREIERAAQHKRDMERQAADNVAKLNPKPSVKKQS